MRKKEEKSPAPNGSGDSSRKARRILPVCFGVLLLLFSAVLIAYPFISDAYYKYYNEREAEKHMQAVERAESTTLHDALELAQAYNAALAVGDELPVAYEDVLNLSGSGVMGYIEIPKLNIYLPIYHGTDYTTLATAVGHLSGTTLPVGGIGTNCVLTGHSGLASQPLFSDIDEMEIGDVFYLNVLGERFCYEVDDISVILPYELDSLSAVPGEDHCTLVTCTPFGVNTHRLLVRGVRLYEEEEPDDDSETDAEDTAETSVSSWQRRYLSALFICIGAAVAAAVVISMIRRRRK